MSDVFMHLGCFYVFRFTFFFPSDWLKFGSILALFCLSWSHILCDCCCAYCCSLSYRNSRWIVTQSNWRCKQSSPSVVAGGLWWEKRILLLRKRVNVWLTDLCVFRDSFFLVSRISFWWTHWLHKARQRVCAATICLPLSLDVGSTVGLT